MSQRWRDLTFLHWAVDPDLVAPLLPRGTRPDLHDGATYTSARRAPGPRGAGGRIVVEPGARIAQPAPLEDFLTARWRLYTRHLGRTLCVPNAHEPWPLHHARLTHLDDSLVAAAGFPGLVGLPPDSVLCSPGVNAVFGVPRRA